MKITEITTQEYRWPRMVPITNGKHTYTHVDFAVVLIHTDIGVTGVGLGNGGEIWRAVIKRLARELVGKDPVNVEGLWDKMWIPKLIGRRDDILDVRHEGHAAIDRGRVHRLQLLLAGLHADGRAEPAAGQRQAERLLNLLGPGQRPADLKPARGETQPVLRTPEEGGGLDHAPEHLVLQRRGVAIGMNPAAEG
jgi:hypothetical protein